MQFSRLAAFALFFLSLGFLVAATPVGKEARELEARNAPDVVAIDIGTALLANIEADVAVLLNVLAGAAVDVAAFADM